MATVVAYGSFRVASTSTGGGGGGVPPTPSGPCTSQTFGVWLESQSLTCVKHIQFDMNLIMGSGLTVDGYYGPGTQAAVESFQKFANIVVDGVVGPQTWDAIQAVAFAAGPQTALQVQL